MSLIINADGEYLTGTGGSFAGAGLTQATMAICVKRDSGSSAYQSYCAIGQDISDSYDTIGLAHNNGSVDCFVIPAGAETRVDPVTNSNSTAWQWLILTFEKDVANKIYTALVGGSVNSGTGAISTAAFNNALDEIRIGFGSIRQAGWFCRAKLAHCAFWNTRLTSGEITDLVSGGTGGISKNPQAIQNANLTFYAPLTSDATVTIGGVSLSATGTLTYDGADNPNVEAYGSTHNVTVANVAQANSVSGAAVYQATANGILTTAPLKNNARTLLANISGWTADVKNATTNALVVRVTGLTTSALGVLTVTDPLIVTGTDYAVEPSHATYGRILPVLTAT